MPENVYRPGSGLMPPFFAGRERELKIFKQKLASTIEGTPMHLAIIGDYAMGKTVLLKRFERIAADTCFTYSCIAGAESTPDFFTSLIRGMSLRVKVKYGEPLLKKLASKVSISELKLSVFGTEGMLRFGSASHAQLSFKEYLSQLWGELSGKARAIVLFIDDLDAVEDFKNTMMTLRNAAMELHGECTVIMIIAGTQRLYDRMYDAHAPLVRFFEPLELESLSPEEAKAAIIHPAKTVGVTYEPEVVDKIAKYCGGQPYYLQEICYHVFEAANNGKKIGMPEFEIGFEAAFSDLTKLLVERRVEKLSQSEISLLALFEPKQSAPFSKVIKSSIERGMKHATAATALTRLKKKGFLRQISTGPNKGEYVVNDTILLMFIQKVSKDSDHSKFESRKATGLFEIAGSNATKY